MFFYTEILEMIETLQKRENKACSEFCATTANYIVTSMRYNKRDVYNSALVDLKNLLRDEYNIRSECNG